MSESVNHPSHYGGDTTYEAIKVIEAWGLGFCIGNSVKYISRAGRKGNAVEDLKKARWYLDREIQNQERPHADNVRPCQNCGQPYGKDTHRCPEMKREQSVQVPEEIAGINRPAQSVVQLHEVPQVQEQASAKKIFHEVGPRSQQWLDRLGKHDQIAEEVIVGVAGSETK